MPTLTHHLAVPDLTAPLQRTAAGLSAFIAVLYGLIWAGVLTVVTAAEVGELGVLGAASLVFLGLAVALWRYANPVLWTVVALFQLPVIAMYVAVGAEREPAFEIWGITIRVAQVVLVAVLTTLVVRALRQRRHVA